MPTFTTVLASSASGRAPIWIVRSLELRSAPDNRGAKLWSPSDITGAGLCIGCGSCVAQAEVASPAVGARMAFDRFGQLKPHAAAEWMETPSQSFSATCPFSPASANEDELASERFPQAPLWHTATGRYDSAYVGAVAEKDFRNNGTSGGITSWLLAELLRTGRVDGVVHVAANDPTTEGRFFGYRVSRTVEAVRAGAKSRYYPVDLSEALKIVSTTPGRYAVVGVPCFVKAVHLLRVHDPLLRERIAYTVALFCGHMKSARFVESFAWQLGVDVADVRSVEFRAKDPDRPANTYTAELTLRDGQKLRRDWWNLVDGDWGAGFFQNRACNFCDDVVGETADASLGDAWVEPYSSDGRGTNVVVLRSPELARLVGNAIHDGRLQLERVDGDFIQATQAAGLRQRREGLSYRLTWRRACRVRLHKRVAPTRRLEARRQLIYRLRSGNSVWSHRLFWLARRCGRPALYIRWARISTAVYHGFAYSRGRIGALVDRWQRHP